MKYFLFAFVMSFIVSQILTRLVMYALHVIMMNRATKILNLFSIIMKDIFSQVNREVHSVADGLNLSPPESNALLINSCHEIYTIVMTQMCHLINLADHSIIFTTRTINQFNMAEISPVYGCIEATVIKHAMDIRNSRQNTFVWLYTKPNMVMSTDDLNSRYTQMVQELSSTVWLELKRLELKYRKET